MATAKRRRPAPSPAKKKARASKAPSRPSAKTKSVAAKATSKRPAKPAATPSRSKAKSKATKPVQAKSAVLPRAGAPKGLVPLLAAPWPLGRPPLNTAKVLKLLPPMADVARPPKGALSKLGHRAPKHFLDFLAALGFGRFGSGFFSVAHPHDLDETLADWLGGFDPTRVPFARTALGDLLYFRDLRTQAAMLGTPGADSACDVSVVFSRYRKSGVIAPDLTTFVDGILGQPKALAAVLRKDLFDGAFERLGPPDADQLYGFVPALALGGVEEPAALERMQAEEHLSLLRQL